MNSDKFVGGQMCMHSCQTLRFSRFTNSETRETAKNTCYISTISKSKIVLLEIHIGHSIPSQLRTKVRPIQIVNDRFHTRSHCSNRFPNHQKHFNTYFKFFDHTTVPVLVWKMCQCTAPSLWEAHSTKPQNCTHTHRQICDSTPDINLY